MAAVLVALGTKDDAACAVSVAALGTLVKDAGVIKVLVAALAGASCAAADAALVANEVISDEMTVFALACVRSGAGAASFAGAASGESCSPCMSCAN